MFCVRFSALSRWDKYAVINAYTVNRDILNVNLFWPVFDLLYKIKNIRIFYSPKEKLGQVHSKCPLNLKFLEMWTVRLIFTHSVS